MKIRKLLNRVRFEALRLFFPSYIEHNIKVRNGECKKCGICCDGCKFLNNDNSCKVYLDRIAYNPLCRPFPIDSLDKKTVNKNCGYTFKKSK